MEPERERHWQARWAEAGLARARRVPGREKFFAIVAYPGSSGFLHLGHLRGLLLADALHRYHRMRGRQVFFPTGTHASGLPAVTFAQRVTDRDPTVVAQLRANEVPESSWSELEDPVRAARFLGSTYLDWLRRLGVLFDEEAYVTTIDEDYQAFIRWQFHRLEEKGALVQKPHYSSVCPVCGPVAVDPAETDLSSGGEAEIVRYTTVPFRLDDGRVLLAATLRPETVYGVTNIWLAPRSPLVVWHHQATEFLVSREAGPHLVEQHGGRLGAEVAPSELLGRSASVPLAERSVPIVPSRLVEPAVGTGVVMSVPAHAPVDWLAVQELDAATRARIGPPPVIIEIADPQILGASERELLPVEGELPAQKAASAAGASRLDDERQRREATERLYRLELVRGRMIAELLGGPPVAEARRQVEARLAKEGGGFDLREFSETVICRNGHEVVIRRIPDQWFLRYSDAAWKEETKTLVSRATIRPEAYAEELPAIVDWFEDRPCTRKGRWLGTPFPRDPQWIIEPIADSTFYPAYYVVRRFVQDGRVPASALTDAFFDFVFLGRGLGEPTVPADRMREIREEFLYWYPLDYNIGGKEHKRVHFPVFLFTHAKLLPEALRPQGVYVHWWLTATGGLKISKKEVGSKGGAIPLLSEALAQWGADALRLFYAEAANADQDIEWRPELVERAAVRLAEIERLVRATAGGGPEQGAPSELDAWLATAVHAAIERARAAFDEPNLREAAQVAYVEFPAIVRRYVQRGGSPGAALQRLTEVWIRLLSPITPHLAEELSVGARTDLAAVQPFPEPGGFPSTPAALRAESFLDRLEDDLRDVLRPVESRGERADAAAFFVAAPWKATVEAWLRDGVAAAGKPPPLRELMERAKADPEVSAHLAQVAAYVQRVAPLVRQEGGTAPEAVDEVAVLRAAQGYLVRRFGFSELSIDPESEGEAHDPMNRRERARPGRPAFYLAGIRRATPSGPSGASGS